MTAAGRKGNKIQCNILKQSTNPERDAFSPAKLEAKLRRAVFPPVLRLTGTDMPEGLKGGKKIKLLRLQRLQ